MSKHSFHTILFWITTIHWLWLSPVDGDEGNSKRKLRTWRGPASLLGSPPLPREGHGLTATADGRLFIFGGSAALLVLGQSFVYQQVSPPIRLNDLHRFDPVAMTWTDLSASILGPGLPPTPRFNLVAIICLLDLLALNRAGTCSL